MYKQLHHSMFIELFRENVRLHPRKTVLREVQRKVNYEQLDQLSNLLAWKLRALGVNHQDKISVYLPQGIDHIVAIIAIFKIGGIYVPLDTNYSRNRLLYIVKDSGVKYVVYDENHDSDIIDNLMKIPTSREISTKQESFVEVKTSLEDVAYIIYTSGSQGNPKGVLVGHKGIVNLAVAQAEAFNISKSDRIFQYASMNFDASVAEWSTALLVGAQLCFPMSKNEKMSDSLIMSCNAYGATMITLPPSLLLWLPLAELTSLKKIVLAGEKVSSGVLDKIPSSLTVFNAYGPTEATVCATYAKLDNTMPSNCIGEPLANVAVYLLDDEKIPVKGTEIGQIYIAGLGLAKGYLHDDALTSEKFIPNPFDHNLSYSSFKTLYATGDYARRLDNGMLEFIGRKDHQVKLHGYRINMAEVEKAILESEIVKDAIVVKVEKNQESDLCAYVIYNDKFEDPKDSADAVRLLKVYLTGKLPDYMIPRNFITIKNWQYNDNGKIDLSFIDNLSLEGHEQYAIKNKLELMSELWCKTLGIDRNIITDDSNFFELGGDSISAMRLRLEAKRAGIKLTIQKIYDFPKYSDMIKQIDISGGILAKNYDNLPSNEVALSPIQNWFFEQKFKNPNHWNQWMFFDVNNSLSPSLIKQILDSILNRHDVFIYKYIYKAGKIRPKIICDSENAAIRPFYFERVVLSDSTFDNYQKQMRSISDNLQSSLDYSKGVLFAVRLLESKFGNKLLFVMHHLIVDAVSWHMILSELNFLAKCMTNPLLKEVSSPRLSYIGFVNQLASYVRKSEFSSELIYWKNISFEIQNKAVMVSRSSNNQLLKTVEYEFDVCDSAQLVSIAKPHLILLSALYFGSDELGESNNFYINMESHGRSGGYDIDPTDLIGWCTALYPLYVQRESIKSDNPFDIVSYFSRRIDEIPRDGSGYGMVRYLHPDDQIRSSLSSDPVPLICFNYLGQWNSHSGIEIFNYSENGVQFSSDIDNHQVHAIEINASMMDSRLLLNVSYDENQVNSNKIDSLLVKMKAFISSLHESACIDESKNKASIQLTPLQESLYYYDMKHTNQPDYNNTYIVQAVIQLSGEIDENRLRSSWGILSDNIDAFKKIYKTDQGGSPMAFKVKGKGLSWDYIHVNRQDLVQKLIDQTLSKHKSQGFIISELPLNRVTLIRESLGLCHMVWSLHHIVADGWCTSIILEMLFNIYIASDRPQQQLLKKYKEFQIDKLFDWIHCQNKFESISYWENLLSSAQSTLISKNMKISADEIVHNVRDNTQMTVVAKLDDIIRIKDISSKNKTTIATIFQVAWSLICSLYSSSNNVTFGYVLSNRHLPIDGIEDAVGVFSQTIPVNVNLSPDSLLSDIIKLLHIQNTNSACHSWYALRDILANVGDNSAPLFDTLLVIQNYPKFTSHCDFIKINDIKWYESTEYPITCTVHMDQFVDIQITSNSKNISADLPKQIIEDYISILNLMIKNQKLSIKSILNGARHRYINQVNDWNATADEISKHDNVYNAFIDIASSCGDSIAIVDNGCMLTYRALIENIDLIATILRTIIHPPAPGIAILLPRSIEFVTSVLSIIKIGIPYMPIDIDLPSARINYMLSHAGVGLVITSNELKCKLNDSFSVFLIDDNTLMQTKNVINTSSDSFKPSEIVNILYTSGSTGLPKGVMTTHKGLLNRLLWMSREFDLRVSDRVLQKTSVSFDVSGWEFLMPLLIGAQCYILPKNCINEPDRINDFIEDNAISCLHFVPSMFGQWLKSLKADRCLSLRNVILSGEALYKQVMLEFFTKSRANLFNLYGPTEASIDVTYWKCDADQDVVLIGKPIANTEIYILDEMQKIIPTGMIGEIYIGGVGVAKGYINSPEMTKKCFVNVFIENKSKFLYRTGDLARYQNDGNIQYLGRIDNQVKLRGYRIETAEVENIILMSGYINAVSVVLADRGDQKILVAYVVLGKCAKSSWKLELRSHILEYLPDYMLPSVFSEIDELPSTISGKIDRSWLCEHAKTITTENTSIYQHNDEDPLCLRFLDIAQKAMGIPSLKLDDNFLAMGGDSIVAIIIANRAKNEGITLKVNDIILSSTIKNCFKNSPSVEDSRSTKPYVALDNCQITPEITYPLVFPLTNAQLGMLFYTLRADNRDDGAYVIHHIYNITGLLDERRFCQAVESLVTILPSLGSSFHWRRLPEPVQHIDNCLKCAAEIVSINDEARGIHNIIVQDREKLVDLGKGSLQKMTLCKVSPSKYKLVWSHNHILFDGWSMQIIWLVLWNLYSSNSDQTSSFSRQIKGFTSYFSFIATQDKELALSYWEKYLSGHNCSVLYPINTIESTSSRNRHSEYKLTLDKDDSQRLIFHAKRLGLSINTIFLHIWGETLCKAFCRDSVMFGLTLSGRNLDVEYINELVGVFIQVIPFLITRDSHKNIKDQLIDCQAKLLHITELYPVSLSEIQACRQSNDKLFDTLYVYENYPLASFDQVESDLEIECETILEKNEYPLTMTIIPGDSFLIRISYLESIIRLEEINSLIMLYVENLTDTITGLSKEVHLNE